MTEISNPPQLPGTPVRIPIEVSTWRVVLGLAMLAAAALAAFSWLPDHAPLSGGEVLGGAARGDFEALARRRLDPKQYWVCWAATIIVALLAARFLLVGLTRRLYAEAYCGQCSQRVVARKRQFGLLCPNDGGAHYAKRHYGEMLSAVVFAGIVAVVIWATSR